MNSFLNFIRSFLSDQKKLKIMFTIIIVLSVLVLGVSFYFVYQEQKEKSISVLVNKLVSEKNEINQIIKEEEPSLEREEFTNKLVSISDELNQVYQKNTGTDNGIRALMTAAQIDRQLGYSSAAEEKLNLVINYHNRSSLAPLAYYFLALIYENQEEYQKALDLLKVFQGEYFTHYLKPVVMFMNARLYTLLDQQSQAVEIYTKILQTQDFSSFFEKAEEQMDLLELKAKWEKGVESSTDDGFAPEYDTSLQPDFLQTNK